ncbi:hypothetical protein ASPFODRAFT_414086 [Aspergillus luchuensis CBS 106.47]|uniref:Secreted protein n=1 Tax=Aspergillus luchuensis (strain CBS 106.47) TaxID=1137211 RepID=A0A1M3TTL8_ASPLC|nr:hypothetical protein ASPFODRAFT_414086 [Aspergillus luchuensis CBS 106.47]
MPIRSDILSSWRLLAWCCAGLNMEVMKHAVRTISPRRDKLRSPQVAANDRLTFGAPVHTHRLSHQREGMSHQEQGIAMPSNTVGAKISSIKLFKDARILTSSFMVANHESM